MFLCCFFCKQKTAYEVRISDWSSDVCSSDLWEKILFLMGAASKNDAPRHFLSDSKALNGNGIFPESTSLSSQTDKSCRKVPQLDAQNPSGEYRGVKLRFGARSDRKSVG